MTKTIDITLAELVTCASAEAWRGTPEVLATGIGPIPRIAAGLAKLTFAPGLMMTDGEAYLVEDPIPLGPRTKAPRYSGWMPYSRVFDSVWSGRRHAMVTPVQVDRWAQGNISALGDDFSKPKVQMLGVRGFPGNSICHCNSMFLPRHSKRTFVEGEVDVVSSVGFRDDRWPDPAHKVEVDIGLVVTDLCVMDFNGPDHAAQVVSLHPGVTMEEVQAQTGFPLLAAPGMGTTKLPEPEQLDVIRKLDPTGIRASVIKDNPPAIRG